MEKFFEKTLSSEKIFSGKIFDVKRDRIIQPTGQEATRDVVVHSGGVVIVAEKDNKILMVKQYRYPVEKTLLELPAGRLDRTGESMLEAAKRELLEETGFVAKKWIDLGFIYSSPGFTTEKLFLFHATELEFKKQQPDEDEIIEFEFYESEKIISMILNGEINDAKTICGILRAKKL